MHIDEWNQKVDNYETNALDYTKLPVGNFRLKIWWQLYHMLKHFMDVDVIEKIMHYRVKFLRNNALKTEATILEELEQAHDISLRKRLA